MSAAREKMIEAVATVLLEFDCMGDEEPSYRDQAEEIVDTIAAPDLYEALSALHARCIARHVGLTDTDDAAAMKQAFAALAKARGEG